MRGGRAKAPPHLLSLSTPLVGIIGIFLGYTENYLVSFPSFDSPVQRGFGDLEGPAYLRYGVALLIEISGNT